MTFEMRKVLESKRALRQRLAARPFAEKLRLLEELRERALAIARSRPVPLRRSEALIPGEPT